MFYKMMKSASGGSARCKQPWLPAVALLATLALLAPATQGAMGTLVPPITRFENGQTESLGGRTYRTTLHARPVNYLKDGGWQPITNQLGSTGDPAMSVGVDELIQFRIADRLAGQSPVLHIGRGATHIKVAVLGTNTPTPSVVSGQSIRFNEAWNNADLEYVVGGHFVKENIYLKAGHPTQFAFRIESHAGFDPATLTFGEFRILPPVLTKPGSAPVSLSWATSTVAGKTVLTVTLPAGDWSGWVLDPTATLQPGAEGFDSWMDSNNPTTNSGTSTEMQVMNSPEKNSIIKYDVSSIPSSATVTSATFSLFFHNTGGTGGAPTINLHRVLRNWVEAEVTFNNWKSANAWTTGGAKSNGNDRSATISASHTTPSTPSNAFEDWTGSQLDTDVQNFVNGTWSNYGWGLYTTTASSLENDFRTSDWTTASERPKLVVVYTVPATAKRAFGVIIYSVFPLGGLW